VPGRWAEHVAGAHKRAQQARRSARGPHALCATKGQLPPPHAPAYVCVCMSAAYSLADTHACVCVCVCGAHRSWTARRRSRSASFSLAATVRMPAPQGILYHWLRPGRTSRCVCVWVGPGAEHPYVAEGQYPSVLIRNEISQADVNMIRFLEDQVKPEHGASDCTHTLSHTHRRPLARTERERGGEMEARMYTCTHSNTCRGRPVPLCPLARWHGPVDSVAVWACSY
jgi:hypothetical protein